MAAPGTSWQATPAVELRRIPVALALLTLLAYAYFAGGQGWNQNSRLALTMAVVEHGELHIDRYHEGVLPTGDKSYAGGHYYSDKAIGTSVAALLPYALARPLLARIEDPRRRVNLAMWFVVVATIALPMAVAIVLLYALALRQQRNAAGALFAPVAVALGTPLWPFGTVLFGHVPAAVWLFLAFWLIRRVCEQPHVHCGTVALAAAAASFAAVTEYPVAPLVVVLAGYACVVLQRAGALRNWRVVLAAVLGAAIPLALLLAYNAACFGAPWKLSYQSLASEEFRAVHATGLVGVGRPSLEVAWYLTFHPVRGLFAQAPVLLLAIPGLWAMWRKPEWRLEAGVIVACFVTLLAINAGFGMWWGGWSANPRHMIPVILLLGVPLAFLRRPWAPFTLLLLAISIVQAFLVVATTPMVPDTALAQFLATRGNGEWIPWSGFSPIYGEAADAFRHGRLAWTAGHSAGLTGWPSLLPLVAALVAGAWALRRWTRSPRRVSAP